jgi:transposase
MDVLHACCAGLDVHKRTVVACVRRVDPAGKVSKNVKTFATMTRDLLDLADWLGVQGVTTIAMESTRTYWKPVFNILESRFTVILVNAHHIKQVPGRKTDVKDSEWIAQLLQHGLLRASFIPPLTTRELRDLTRQRTQLVCEKTAVANRLQKILEDANIKLGSVASNVLGVSGRAMIEAIIRGEHDPVKLAELARRRLRGKIPQLQLALRGSHNHRNRNVR